MESHAVKKTRLDSDPFEALHLDVHEMIFQHLSFADILNYSLVSKSWYANNIGSSHTCMKKIRIKITEESPKSSNFDAILSHNSKRKYQNIELYNISKTNIVQIVQEVLDGRSWKKVQLCECDLSRNDYCEIFKVIEQHVEELHICFHSNLIRDYVASVVTLKFPNLTELRLRRSSAPHDDGFIELFGDCKNLKFFLTDGEKIETILSNNNRLEDLHVDDLHNPDPFELNYQFQLKSFALDSCSVGCIPNINFLRSQASSLEYLNIEVDTETVKLCFQMPKLAKLKLINPFEYENLRLIPSKSIRKLKFDFEHEVPMLRALISATPELRSLSLAITLTDTALQVIAKYCNKLESIAVTSVTSSFGHVNNRVFLPNLKRLRCLELIEESLKQEIEATPPEQRTPLAKLILKRALVERDELAFAHGYTECDDWFDLSS